MTFSCDHCKNVYLKILFHRQNTVQKEPSKTEEIGIGEKLERHLQTKKNLKRAKKSLGTEIPRLFWLRGGDFSLPSAGA